MHTYLNTKVLMVIHVYIIYVCMFDYTCIMYVCLHVCVYMPPAKKVDSIASN